MAKKFWKSAPSNWKEQAELNDRLRQQQMEEEAFGADTPSTVSQMLRTGRVLPSQPAQQRPKFQGPSPTSGGRGQPQAPVVTKAHEGTGRLVNGIWVPDEGEVDWEKESAIPPRKSPLEYAAGAVGNTFGSLLRTPGEIARGVPRGAVRQILESINASNPAVASRLAELTNIDPGLRPGTTPAGAGEQAGQLLTSLGGFTGPAISPEEMAKNPLIGLGPEAQIAGDIAFKAAGPAARQAVQGVKGYPKKLVETAPRVVPERQAMGMAKKVGKLPSAESISDFEVGRDKVMRRGDKSFVVDTKGERAPVEVQPDGMTDQYRQNIAKLTPERREGMIEATKTTPYLSDEGRAERLALLQGVEVRPSVTGASERIVRNKGRVEEIQASITSGQPVILRTYTRAIRLNKPEYIRMASDGTVQIPSGKKWVALTDPQVNDLVNQSKPSQARAVPPAAKAGQAKEPWQMTKAEFGDQVVYHGSGKTGSEQIVKEGLIGHGKGTTHLSDTFEHAKVYSLARGRYQRGIGDVFLAYKNDLPPSTFEGGMQINTTAKGAKDFGIKAPFEGGKRVPVRARIPYDVADPHRYLVEQALASGKPVPAKVLADYPDLAASASPAAESVGAKGAVPTVPPSQAKAPQVAAPTVKKTLTVPKEALIPDEAPSIEGVGFPERETPLTVEGAGEGAMPFGPAAAKPPTVPPTTGAVPPARGPKPQNVPQGVTDTLAQAAAIVERDRPGGITRLVDRLPGLRQVQRALHPSVGMPEHIIKAHIGGGHAEAVVSNRLRAEVTQTVKQLDTAFGRGATSGKGKNLAAFTGPAEKKVPFSGTLYDIMQRPDMYDLTAEQRQLLTAIHAGRSESFNAVKSYYGLKVREFPVPEGAVHLGNVDKTKGALEMAGSEQAAVRRGAAKERFYDTGADRYLHDKAKFPDNPDKWFTPVTDVAALMSRRADQELVTEAGQSVFKAGLGGKTRLEVLQEIDPGLANKMLGLKNRLAKLKGYGKILRDKQAEAIDDFLSGAMEDADLASLHSDLDVKLEPGRYVAKSQAGRTLADVQQEIDSVKAAIAELRPGWRTAKTNPYVMVTEGNLYQYYPASEAPIIRRLTERSNSATLRAFDNLRATAFGGDLSPASIQGVNSMLLDPLRTGRVLFEVGPKRLFSEAAMAADVRANPESWALFTRATGLDPLIGPGAEYTTGFLGKIPKVGKYWNRFNETVYRPTQWAMKKSFDSIYADGVKMGLTSEQAAAIAADDVTKLIPNYSYRRMGMSQAQAAKYRAVLTSVSFLTQPAALMSDATEGILKMGTLQTLSPSEAYAVKRVLTLVAATETIAVVSNAYYASQNGKDVGQAIKESVSPTSGYFMSAVLPNGSRIGLGGPFRSIIKAVWPAEVKGLPAPVPFAGIVRFARAKVSPALSIVFDLARNQDYFGQKIMQGDFPINALQGLEYAVEGAAPLTIGSAMEQVRRGTPEDIPSQMGSQFLGVNLVDEAPPSVWKAAEETNKVFRKLPFMSKYDINLGSIGSTFDKIVMTPEQRIVRQNTMGAVVTPRMKTFVESPSFAKMKPDDQKVAIDKEMDRIKGMLTKVYNAYGKGEPAPDLTGKMAPTIKDLPTAEVEKHVLEIESLKPYLDIPDQVMAQMGNRKVKLDSGGFTTIKMYMELSDQLDQQAEDAAKAGDLVARDKYLVAAKARKVGNVYKAVSAEVTRLKNEYRKAHPEADALLYTWYGLTPKWKYQQKATPQPVVPTQSLATAGTLAR